MCATVLHVDYGLLIGLVFSFFTVVLRSQKYDINIFRILSVFQYEQELNIYYLVRFNYASNAPALQSHFPSDKHVCEPLLCNSFSH